MSEVWVAAIGAVISTGIGVAANAATQPGFGGASPIKPKLIDINALNKQGIDFDKFGYDWADKDLARRLPGLVTGDSALIEEDVRQLNGPLDPAIQHDFARNELERGLAVTGGGNSAAGLELGGGALGNAIAAGLGTRVQEKQDIDRVNLLQDVADHPELSFGLDGKGALALEIGNAEAENQYNVAKYQYQTQKDAQGGGF